MFIFGAKYSFMIDTHVHSCHSYDSDAPIADIAEAALRRGLDKLIITEHYDIDAVMHGEYPPPSFEAISRELDAINDKYSGSLRVYLGIELGQGYLDPRESRRLIESYDFSFVISSVHNLEGRADFWFEDFSRLSLDDINEMYKAYISELMRAARVRGAHTLAHITYPTRYIYRDRKLDLELERFFDDYRRLFHVMVEEGVALEINTSGCRSGHKLSPTAELLKLYFDCGGEKLTVGSDAHKASDCGDLSLDMLDAETASLIADVAARDLSDVIDLI